MSDSLRGRFLVAARHLRDPNFHRTVVLLVEHNDEGAMGLVVNRPSELTVGQALDGHFAVAGNEDPVFVGGPVEPRALFILHGAEDVEEHEAAVVPGLFIGSSEQEFDAVMRRAAEGDATFPYRIYRGCSGWGPGQLEGELRRGDWHPLPAARDDVLEGDAYELWDRLVQRLRVQHRILPHPPADPEWN